MTDEERLAAIRADYTCPCPEGAGIVRKDVCFLLSLVDRLKAERDRARILACGEEVFRSALEATAEERDALRARVAKLERVAEAARVLVGQVPSDPETTEAQQVKDVYVALAALDEGESPPAGVASGIGLKASDEGLVPVTEVWHIGPDGKPDEHSIRIHLRGLSPAARLEMVLDLYAPQDEDGERHPEAGIIDAEQLKALLETP